MATMKWTKPSAKTLAYFERLAPGAPLQTRKMFGMPSRFLNGHLLVGVFENTLMLHLNAQDRFECIAAGAKPFTPMGREMKEYVAIAPGTFEDMELKEWIVRGMRFLGSLPPKLGKPRKAKTKTGKTAKPMKSARKPEAKRKATASKRAVKRGKGKAPARAKRAKLAKASKGKKRR